MAQKEAGDEQKIDHDPVWTRSCGRCGDRLDMRWFMKWCRRSRSFVRKKRTFYSRTEKTCGMVRTSAASIEEWRLEAIPRWRLVECRTVVIGCTGYRSRVCSHLLRVDPRPGVLNELPGTSGSGCTDRILFRRDRTGIRAACAPVEREHPCCSNRAPGSRLDVDFLRDQTRKRSHTRVDRLAVDLNGLC